MILPGPQAMAATTPRPEHPMPQFLRTEWLNLNGVWEFAETDENADATYLGSDAYPDRIVVPFCRESKLSGLERKGFVKNVWYRRTFELPKTWKSPRTILHIGACDWRTRMWLNGRLLGEHVGGSTPIASEITKHLKPGVNTVIISAYDDCRTGLQASGKQSWALESFGCVYTRTTGIWQTVWLEGAGSTYTTDFHVTPDPKGSRIVVQAEVDGPCQGLNLVLTARAKGAVVGKATIPADWRNMRAVIDLSKKHLWTVEDPFLYDLELRLVKDGKTVDSVKSYFGLRDVSIQGAAILINGRSVFQRLILDQGFYPDGIWTAPTDDELKQDVLRSKILGFNGARLHEKVFEPRFLYWADKLGYMVWGEYPNWGLNYSPAVHLPVIDEWMQIMRRDRNHPSIIGWCPFNETPGAAGDFQDTVVSLTKLIDPTRPVIDTSGFVHSVKDPDVMDAHDYDQNPASFRTRWCDDFGPGSFHLPRRYGSSSSYAGIPFMVSEYGGTFWTKLSGATKDEYEGFYARYKGLTDALLDSRYMFGFCYTQLTDVEQEQNGMYTYDRKLKFDAKRIRDINERQAAIEKDPSVALIARHLESGSSDGEWLVLVGAAVDGRDAKPWQYTFDVPAENWTKPDFDDRAWQSGFGGFGNKGAGEKTSWTTSDIWLRQEFDYSGTPFRKALLVAHYDNATEVYLNGTLIWSKDGWNDRYDGFEITDKVKAALKPGRNTIAVHTHQDTGGQFIDLALIASSAR